MTTRLEETNEPASPRATPLGRVTHRSETENQSSARIADERTEMRDELARAVAARSVLSAELAVVRHALEETRDHLSEMHQKEAEARRLALHDPLTGLANRALFEENLEQGMALVRRHATGLAVLFIDIDRFKRINDRHGHAAGDAVLRRVATCIQDHVREGDTVCRWGGDEFTCLLLEIATEADVLRIAAKMATWLSQECEIGGVRLNVEASIGIAMYPQDSEGVASLLEHADQAMYHAKKVGRGIVLYRECCGQ